MFLSMSLNLLVLSFLWESRNQLSFAGCRRKIDLKKEGSIMQTVFRSDHASLYEEATKGREKRAPVCLQERILHLYPSCSVSQLCQQTNLEISHLEDAFLSNSWNKQPARSLLCRIYITVDTRKQYFGFLPSISHKDLQSYQIRLCMYLF